MKKISNTQKVTNRILELRSTNMPWTLVKKTVDDEGFLNNKGSKYNIPYLATLASLRRKRISIGLKSNSPDKLNANFNHQLLKLILKSNIPETKKLNIINAIADHS